jgi:hypothetical protein
MSKLQSEPGRFADQYVKPFPVYQPGVYSGADGVCSFLASNLRRFYRVENRRLFPAG